MCDPATNVMSKLNLIGTSVETNNISCVLKVTEAREETIDWEVQSKIKYYNNLIKRIWTICPPIFLGKTLYPLNHPNRPGESEVSD